MSIQSLVKKLEQAKLSWMQGEEIKIEFIDACIDLGKQAIEDAEKQEPYGWVSQHTTKGMYEWQFNKELSGVYKDTAISILPVYTQPQPKHEWVGLTHEEIDYQAKKDNHGVYFALGALWAEAKLKEKNT